MPDFQTGGLRVGAGASSGAVAIVSTSLNTPDGIAIEPGGATALVCEKGARRLLRVDLATGTNTVVAGNLNGCTGVRIEAGGTTALVASAANADPTAPSGLVRVNLLATNSMKTLVWVGLTAFAIEPGGNSALIGYDTQCCGVTGQLGRVNFTTGAVDVLAGPFFGQLRRMQLDASGTNLYFTDAPTDTGPIGTLFKMAAP